MSRLSCFTLAAMLLLSTSVAAAEKVIEVTGNANVQLKPDLVTIVLAVVKESDNLVKSKKAADTVVKKVLAEMEKIKVDRDNIKAAQIVIKGIDEQKRDPFGGNVDAESAVKAYRVTRSINITIPVERLDEVLETVVDAGANQVSRLRYKSSKYKEAWLKCREEAIEDAKKRAKYLAESFDAKLGDVVKIRQIRSYRSAPFGASDPFGTPSYTPEDLHIEYSIAVEFALAN